VQFFGPTLYCVHVSGWSLCVSVYDTALRIHISKPCYIGLLEIGGYEMTLRGEMNVKVYQYIISIVQTHS